jgi:hypothetical protein
LTKQQPLRIFPWNFIPHGTFSPLQSQSVALSYKLTLDTMRNSLLNIFATTAKGLRIIAALPLAAGVLTACGGGAAFEEDSGLGSSPGRASIASKTGMRGPNQGDFNPDIWNEHNWYECDCSRDPSKPLGG